MPKKKTSGASAKGPKLPKEIAGVKIGKELRGAIAPVMRFANHPMVSETLAAALLAGAGALGGKKGGSAAKASGDAASAAIEAGKAATKAATGANRLGLALAVAAGEIATRIVASYDLGGAAKAAKPKAPKPKAKVKVGAKAKPRTVKTAKAATPRAGKKG